MCVERLLDQRRDLHAWKDFEEKIHMHGNCP